MSWVGGQYAGHLKKVSAFELIYLRSAVIN
jgi:hypothetical protein